MLYFRALVICALGVISLSSQAASPRCGKEFKANRTTPTRVARTAVERDPHKILLEHYELIPTRELERMTHEEVGELREERKRVRGLRRALGAEWRMSTTTLANVERWEDFPRETHVYEHPQGARNFRYVLLQAIELYIEKVSDRIEELEAPEYEF